MKSRVAVALVVTLAVSGAILAGVYYYKEQNQANPDQLSGLKAADSDQEWNTNTSPDLSTDESGLSRSTVVIQTSRGVLKYKFYSNDAPETSQRIIELINSKFYNGLTFHRVVPGFVVQGGDPKGDGTGGSGTRLKAEFNNRPHSRGAVAMARTSDPNSADSQFYICLEPQPQLDGKYTVFGQLVAGEDVITQIQPGDTMTSAYIE